MSVDTLAIIDRKNDFFDDVGAACAVMATQCPAIARLRDSSREILIAPACHPAFSITKFLSPLAANTDLHCRNFSITVSGKLVSLYHGRRHAVWAGESSRDLFTDAVREVALLVGATRAVFVPEQGYGARADDSVDTIVAFMESHYGPPASSFDDLAAKAKAASDYWHPGCFFIEDYQSPL